MLAYFAKFVYSVEKGTREREREKERSGNNREIPIRVRKGRHFGGTAKTVGKRLAEKWPTRLARIEPFPGLDGPPFGAPVMTITNRRNGGSQPTIVVDAGRQRRRATLEFEAWLRAT